ncbi:uncharacterized protein [Dendropsophus ebraccatus]|uniref:uncharacterized protein isoform X2 n=1 Tax=Dendropsophus ebraccatus TaxID=150705 RepID=UPI0038313F7D
MFGAGQLQEIRTGLEVLVSVPSTHIGDTEIGPAVLTASAGHPFLYSVVAQKNQTQCINSTNSQCSSMIKAPAVDVSVTSQSSNESLFSYSKSFSRSQQLLIQIEPKVSVTPQSMDGESDAITVTIDVMYYSIKTRMVSLRSSRKPTTFSLKVEFITNTSKIVDNHNGQGNGQGNGDGSGQATLRCAPLSALILLTLLPVLLLK